jgi:hypothetical protein
VVTYDAAMQTAQPTRPAGAAAQDVVGRVADGLLVASAAFVPIFVPNIGGRVGLVFSDVLFALAMVARLLHIAMHGLPRRGLERHSFLLGALGLLALAGIVAGFAHHQNPLLWTYLRLIITTAGSVFLVATHGSGDWARSRLAILRALGLGFVVLALSSFFGPGLQGRPVGWSIHPNALGHSCVMGIAVCMWLADNTSRREERFFWMFGTALTFYGLMQSGSRGGLLGFLVGSVLYLALRGSKRAVVGAVVLAWASVLLVGSGVVKLPVNNPITRFLHSEETSASQSDEARRDLLAEDFKVIDADPWFGAGFEDDERLINVHVVYLQGWVAAGAAAAFSLMLIGATTLVLPFITPRRDLVLAAGAAAIAVAWLFTNILTLRDQWVYLACAFGSAGSINALRPDIRREGHQ